MLTRQFKAIDDAVRRILSMEMIPIIEGPKARTWDDESRNYFAEIKVETMQSITMYTSVHYIVEAKNMFRNTGEIQVRTLAEGLWGEVDHKFNYPHRTDILACSEPIKVLARITSSCSRLVDSIFKTFDDHKRHSTQVVTSIPKSAGHSPRKGVAQRRQGRRGGATGAKPRGN